MAEIGVQPLLDDPEDDEEQKPVAPALPEDAYEKLELDLVSTLDTIVDPNTKTMRDLKVDDRDFPEFPNVGRFILDKQGLHLRPFSRQMWMHLHLFHEWCPDCTKDKKLMADIMDCPINMDPEEMVRERVQMLNHGKCPKCGKTKLDFFRNKTLNPYMEFAGLLGQRVGKSTMLVAPAATYTLHKFMKLPRPWEVFSLNPTTLFSTVVAQTYQAAYDQLWLPIKTYIEGSPWFTDYHKMLGEIGARKGDELFSLTTTQLYYKHRALMVYPSGPNRKTLRGKTRFFSATDEHDFFDGSDDSEKVKMNGKEVRTSLNNSLANVRIEWRNVVKSGRPSVPGGYSMYVSSPDHAMGVLTQLVKQKANSSTILALNLATWDIHPKLTRNAIIRAFDPDPMRLERDFGARPPLNTSPFMEDPDAFEALCSDERPNRVKISVEPVIVGNKTRIRPSVVHIKAPQKMRRSILALDAGYSNNSFGFAVISPPVNVNDKAKALVHAVGELIPGKTRGNVDFNWAYERMLLPIARELNVGAILADRWNSLKLLHDFQNDLGIHAEQYSLRYSDFTFVKSYFDSGAILLPKLSMPKGSRQEPDLTKYPQCFADHPVDHLCFQAATVRDMGKGVEKGPGLTDDIWRAVVLGARFVLDEDFCKVHLKGVENRRATGGIAAGSYQGSVSSWGNNAQGATDPSQVKTSNVAAASTSMGTSTGLPYFTRATR